MGLGKTLQSIAIMAYHYEFRRCQGPHLICVPKSTLSNWMKEITRWCPALRVMKFHGSREDREEMVDNFFTNEAAAHDGSRPDKQIMNGAGELIDDNTDNPRTWDVCITTYEIANMEKKTLQKFTWKYLVIDEAHRLKNDASMFSKTVRSFKTSNRLLLTGTVSAKSRYHVNAFCQNLNEAFFLFLSTSHCKTTCMSCGPCSISCFRIYFRPRNNSTNGSI